MSCLCDVLDLIEGRAWRPGRRRGRRLGPQVSRGLTGASAHAYLIVVDEVSMLDVLPANKFYTSTECLSLRVT